jgi:type IV pilus assembly protein PilQ
MDMRILGRHAALAAHVAVAGLAAIICASLMLSGCTKKPKVDPFSEHWRVKAEKSQGYSPTAKPRKIEFSETTITSKAEEIVKTEPVNELPTQPVSLKMYNTDLVAVLRALARAVDVNIVLSSSIGGGGEAPAPQGQTAGGEEKPAEQAFGQEPSMVNINITRAPWDQAFISILRANGLDYAWDGDIIRVYTLADLEMENKMKEAREKNIVQTAKIKEVEPYVTARVEINFSDLDKLEFTLNALCGNDVSLTKEGEKREFNRGDLGDQGGQGDNQGGGGSTRQPGQLRGYVVADSHTNSIIIQAPREDAEKMVKIVEQLDQPRPQIMLKAHIIEARKEALQELGVQWGGLLKGTGPGGSPFMVSPARSGGSATSNTFNVGDAVFANPATGATTVYWPGSASGPTTTYSIDPLAAGGAPYFGTGMSGTGFGLNFPTASSLTSAMDVASGTGLGGAGMGLNFLFGAIGENMLEAQLTALAESNKINIVASPSITTLENQTAFTENGKKIPYVSVSQNGTNVQFADAVMRLEMLPHIVDGDNLRMKVKVIDDQVDENQANWVSGNPPIYKRQTETTLIVQDGDTIVISGLTRDVVTTGGSGVPFLKDIPGLGWAFKSTSDGLEKVDMLIFITPYILNKKPMELAPTVSFLKGAGLDSALIEPGGEDAPNAEARYEMGADGRPKDREY